MIAFRCVGCRHIETTALFIKERQPFLQSPIIQQVGFREKEIFNLRPCHCASRHDAILQSNLLSETSVALGHSHGRESELVTVFGGVLSGCQPGIPFTPKDAHL